jgi:hypothetical protein
MNKNIRKSLWYTNFILRKKTKPIETANEKKKEISVPDPYILITDLDPDPDN